MEVSFLPESAHLHVNSAQKRSLHDTQLSATIIRHLPRIDYWRRINKRGDRLWRKRSYRTPSLSEPRSTSTKPLTPERSTTFLGTTGSSSTSTVIDDPLPIH
jgi:hypothetical protein